MPTPPIAPGGPPPKPEHPIVLPPDQVWPPLGSGSDFAGQWVVVVLPGVGAKWIWIEFKPQQLPETPAAQPKK
jgi:hypothetical protein